MVKIIIYPRIINQSDSNQISINQGNNYIRPSNLLYACMTHPFHKT